MASLMNDAESVQALSTAAEGLSANQSIDVLFDKMSNRSWEPIRPPQALGELLDSRFMIPLLFPSNPRLLAALPGKRFRGDKRISMQSLSSNLDKVSIRSTTDLPSPWRCRNRKVREVGVRTLRWIDGANSAARWERPLAHDHEHEDETEKGADLVNGRHPNAAPLTQRPSALRAKARQSIGPGDITQIDGSFFNKGAVVPEQGLQADNPMHV